MFKAISRPLSLTTVEKIGSVPTKQLSLAIGDRFGDAVAYLGDLQGDRGRIVAVGAPGDDTGGANRGALHLLSFNTNGVLNASIAKIAHGVDNGPELSDNDEFGHAVAGLGDIYNNGGTVVAVGAPGDDTGVANRGALYLLSFDSAGALTETVKVPSVADDLLASGHFFGDQFGVSVANVGDLDGGGGTVVAVGASGEDGGGVHRGALYLLSFDTAGAMTVLASIVDGAAVADGSSVALDDGDFFGSSVANVGDLDGGGGTVVAVGAYGDEPSGAGPGVNHGALYLLSFDPAGSLSAIDKIDSDTANGPAFPVSGLGGIEFGRSVAAVGDLRAVGGMVVAVGSYADHSGGRTVGDIHLLSFDAAGVLSGSERIGSGVENAPDVEAQDFFGLGVAAIGNLYSESGTAVVVGAPGVAGGSQTKPGAIHVLAYREQEESAVFVCRNGVPVAGESVASNVERCVSCITGYSLNGVRCELARYTCANGVAAQVDQPLVANEEKCVRCARHHHPEGVRCAPNAFTCENGSPFSSTPSRRPSPHGQTHCARCLSTHFRVSERFSGENRTRCDLRGEYFCKNGTPLAGRPNQAGDVHLCNGNGCDTGYVYKGGKCVLPDLYAMTCAQVAAYEFPDSTIDLPRSTAVSSYGPIPTDRQIKWQHLEYYGFIHYGINTYYGQGWGYGNEDLTRFDPPDNMDTDQWVCAFKRGRMRGIILTAKHHDGSALWPSAYTGHDMEAATNYKKGKGDVVKDFAASLKKYKMKMGIYISPWDRNHPDYAVPATTEGGVPPYVQYFRNQVTELLTLYGDNVFEMWFDGANGGNGWHQGTRRDEFPHDPNPVRRHQGKDKGTLRRLHDIGETDKDAAYDAAVEAYYGFESIRDDILRPLAPDAVAWGTPGMDAQYTGSEWGVSEPTHWATQNWLGNVTNIWQPTECDSTIHEHQAWFHNEDTSSAPVRSTAVMLNMYYRCVGRNTNLLLNMPVNPGGVVPNDAINRLKDVTRTLDRHFATDVLYKKSVTATNVRGNDPRFAASNANDGDLNTYWTTNDGASNASLTFDLGSPTTIDTIVLQEYIALGQRVADFDVHVEESPGVWTEVELPAFPFETAARNYFNSTGSFALYRNVSRFLARPVSTTIGYKRILRFRKKTTSKVRVTIVATKDNSIPLISNVEVYNAGRTGDPAP